MTPPSTTGTSNTSSQEQRRIALQKFGIGLFFTLFFFIVYISLVYIRKSQKEEDKANWNIFSSEWWNWSKGGGAGAGGGGAGGGAAGGGGGAQGGGVGPSAPRKPKSDLDESPEFKKCEKFFGQSDKRVACYKPGDSFGVQWYWTTPSNDTAKTDLETCKTKTKGYLLEFYSQRYSSIIYQLKVDGVNENSAIIENAVDIMREGSNDYNITLTVTPIDKDGKKIADSSSYVNLSKGTDSSDCSKVGGKKYSYTGDQVKVKKTDASTPSLPPAPQNCELGPQKNVGTCIPSIEKDDKGNIIRCSTKGIQQWKKDILKPAKYSGTCEAMSGSTPCDISADKLPSGCAGKIEGCSLGPPVLVKDAPTLKKILEQQGKNISGHFGTGNQLFPDENNNNQIACSKSCGNGYTVTTRYMQNTDGAKCGSLTDTYATKACNTHECPVNCKGDFIPIKLDTGSADDTRASTCVLKSSTSTGIRGRETWDRYRVKEHIVTKPKEGKGTCDNEGKYQVGEKYGGSGDARTGTDGTAICPGPTGTIGNMKFPCKCLHCGPGGADITKSPNFLSLPKGQLAACGDFRVPSIAKICSPTQSGGGCYGKTLSKFAPIKSCDCKTGFLFS